MKNSNSPMNKLSTLGKKISQTPYEATLDHVN